MRPAHELGHPEGPSPDDKLFSVEKVYDYSVEPEQVHYRVRIDKLERPFSAKQWAAIGRQIETLARSLEKD